MAIKAIAAKAFFDTFWECRTFVLNLESAYSFTSPSCIIFQKCTRIFFYRSWGKYLRRNPKEWKSRLPNGMGYAIICSRAAVLQGGQPP